MPQVGCSGGGGSGAMPRAGCSARRRRRDAANSLQHEAERASQRASEWASGTMARWLLRAPEGASCVATAATLPAARRQDLR
jgi:hypothetical protein